ncbi:hypothetical protein SteCoe_7399 [Stentor coeruleus]|uniref:FPL domain-containing protein n=1 Tax=Stentor coeruleus TaxID=5963 RepID=A0A1R2CMU4_9CILI|nr:hypothetical protein SteCoe_7399 [Stentor coeruleus]
MESFDPENFQNILREIRAYSVSPLEYKNSLIEELRKLAEFLVWSEQHKQTFFSEFIRHDTQQDMVNILENSSDQPIILQLLQTATLLAHNLSKDEDKKYLLSSKFFTMIVSFPFDFTDEEVVEHYMSYIKGLAINISKQQLMNFLITQHFCLFTGAMMFFNYKETLIKTASRTIILTVIKLNHDKINEYVLESGFFFSLVSNFWQIVKMMNNCEKNREDGKIEGFMNEFVDLLYYMNDIFDQDMPDFNSRLSCTFLATMMPVLVGSVCGEAGESYRITCHLALMIIAKVMQLVNTSLILDPIVIALFADNVPVKIADLCRATPPKGPEEEFVIDFNITKTNSFMHKTLQKLNPDESYLDEFSFNEALMSLFILQACVSNQSISKSLLSSLGLLSQKDIHKQELLNGILGEFQYYANSYSDKVLDSIFSLLISDRPIKFLAFCVSCKIIYELTCGPAYKIHKKHEKQLHKILRKIILRLTEALDNEGLKKFLIDFFETEWNFVKNINFSTCLPIPLYRSYVLLSDSANSGISIRKLSTDSTGSQGLNTKKVQEDMRAFFIVYKLIKIIKKDDPNEYPLEYSDILELKINDYVDTRNFIYDVVTIDNKIVYVSETDSYLLLLEVDPELAPAARVIEILPWKTLKVSTDITRNAIIVNTQKKQNPNIFLQIKNRPELNSLQDKIVQRINFSIYMEGEMIRSFLETLR